MLAYATMSPEFLHRALFLVRLLLATPWKTTSKEK